MKYYIFSFRSRNQAMRFFENLNSKGMQSRIISTPRCISVGCGLSVKIQETDIALAKNVFFALKPDTFIGLFYYNGASLNRVDC